MTLLEFSELIRNFGLIFAAAVGIAIAVWRAIALDRQSRAQAETVTQNRREHVATLFADAVRQLDDDKLHVRLGAIFTLREIVEAFPELSRPTVDLLSAYLEISDYGDEEPPRDIVEIINVIIGGYV